MSRGFSLIEILVVIVIIGVLALAVTLGVASASTERQLTRESERVQALIEHACVQSELTGREIGVRVDEAGYAFFIHNDLYEAAVIAHAERLAVRLKWEAADLHRVSAGSLHLYHRFTS